MSRSVKFRRPSPTGHYDHQRSDSGFSDCESRTSNPDRDFLTPSPGYEDPGYSIRQALETARQETEKWRAKAGEFEEQLKETRNDFEQTKAHMRALDNETQVLSQEIDELTKTNKDLTDQIAQLQDTVKELKKANRKSSGTASPASASSGTSESSDEKKVRRSSSKRPPKERAVDKEEKRGREKEERASQREKEERAHQREKDRRKAASKALQDETDRLRKRFETNTRAEESDAKSSITSTKSGRHRRDDSYIEPMGLGAPRPSAPVPPSPSRQYTSSYTPTTGAGYPTAPAYASIREPFAATTPRSVHPSVYVTEGYVEDDDAYRSHPRSTRHPR